MPAFDCLELEFVSKTVIQNSLNCDCSMSPVERFIVTCDKTALLIRTWGDCQNPAVVLVHGLDQNSIVWSTFAEYLSVHYFVVALDIRGNGLSAHAKQGNYQTERLCLDLHQVCIELSLSSFHLVGHSLGGKICLEYSAQYSESVLSLVLVDSAPILNDTVYRFLKHKYERPTKFTSVETYKTFLRNSYLLCSDQDIERLAATNIRIVDRLIFTNTDSLFLKAILCEGGILRSENVWSLLGRLVMPVLVIQGELSSVLTDGIVTQMKTHLSSLRSVKIPRAGHSIMLDQPESLAKSLELFFITQ
ncbi:alpha/beta hydrolase [Vibrio vulnificus]|nr:alpha/beta hydrolase [Vibrio vulnificus]